jgi:hypothetical protein
VVAVVAAVVAEPVSAWAPAAVAVVEVVAVVAVVVLALPSSDKPIRRKAERCRLPQALRSTCRCLDWCRRRLLSKLHRS